jgi:ABC-type sugar transport system ATPase subunit
MSSFAGTIVEARGIAKRFGGAQALDGVDLALARGEVHCLVGENGAGKSTLGRILSGVVRPDAGRLIVDGRDAEYDAPRAALRDGITIVEQELALAPAMTVAENVLLGLRRRDLVGETGRRAILRGGAGRRFVAELSRRYDLDLDVDRRVESLPIAEQQKVEILRALGRRARLIVMDEPTARLDADAARNLLRIIRSLAAAGTTVVYVSHFLEEVLEVADTVSVLRNGRLVQTGPAAASSPQDLIHAMLGRQVDLAFPPKRPAAADAAPTLSVRGLSGGAPVAVRDISFDVRAGEVLGLAGLVGSGRTELARLIFGAERPTGGSIRVDGGAGRFVSSPARAIEAGIAYLPESRKDLGLFMQMSVTRNVTLPALARVSRGRLLSRRAERRETLNVLARLRVQPADPRRAVGTLSGGNQQKVLFGKWLWHGPRVLIADEPTRGVDVGAKFAIYELLGELAERGMAIVLISSELEELVGLAHRVVVMSRGAQVTTLEGDDVREDAILRAAFGQEPRAEVGAR